MYFNSDDGILLQCRTESVREFIIWLDGELKQLGGEDKDGLFPVSHEVFEPQREYLFVKEKYVHMSSHPHIYINIDINIYIYIYIYIYIACV